MLVNDNLKNLLFILESDEEEIPSAEEVLYAGYCEDEDNIFYHATPTRNLKAIMKQGLKPGTGKGSNFSMQPGLDKWSVGKLFLSAGENTAWMWQEMIYDMVDEPVAVLQVTLNKNQMKQLKVDVKSWEEDDPCAFYITDTIKPSQIKVIDTGEEISVLQNESFSNVDSLLLFLEGRTKTDDIIEKVLKAWVEEDKKAPRGPHWFPPRELFRYREYMRRTRPDLQKSIGEKGFDPDYPIQLKFGKDGHVKIEEGNHRLKTAIQLKLDKVPVVFNFGDMAMKQPMARDIWQMRQDKELARKRSKEAERAAFNRKYGIDKAREKSAEEERKRIAALSPEERKKEEEQKQATVDELMDLLGF